MDAVAPGGMTVRPVQWTRPATQGGPGAVARVVLALGIGLLLAATAAHASQAAPVAKIQAYSGGVAWSGDAGRSWQPLQYTPKYLTPGSRISTTTDSSATIVLLSDNSVRELKPRSVVELTEGAPRVLVGELSEPIEQAGSFVQGMRNKLERAQRYLSVRRGDTGDVRRFRPGRVVHVHAGAPDLVWANVFPDVGYRLTIGGRTWSLPPQGDAPMVRFTLPELPPGTYDYNVEIVQDDEVVFSPPRGRTLVWADEDEIEALEAALAPYRDGPNADPVIVALIEAERGFKVVAMDTLRGYLEAHPEESAVRPLLAQIYAELGLADLQAAEAERVRHGH